MRNEQHAESEVTHEERDAEPVVSDDVTMLDAQTNVEAASSSTTLQLPVQQPQHPALTAENSVAWLIERAVNAPTSLGDAQRSLEFIRALQAGSAATTGWSTNVDMVANVLGRGENYPPSDSGSSSGEGETQAQVARKYMNCGQSEASDPDLWAYLHYGHDDDVGGNGNGSGSLHNCGINLRKAMRVLQDVCVFNFSDECWQ
eukprot:s60_g24.t1